jgi:hypothetical protein
MSWEIPIKKPRDEGTTGDGTNTVHNYVCLTKKNVWDILLCPSKLIAVHVLVAFVCDIFWLVVWNMTFIFPIGMMIQSDELIFFEGVETTN